jgi:hypothetical protein
MLTGLLSSLSLSDDDDLTITGLVEQPIGMRAVMASSTLSPPPQGP